MKRENKQSLKVIGEIIFLLIVVSTLIKVYYELKWMDLTLGILKIEKNKDRIAKIKCKSLMFISFLEDEDELIKIEMEKLGWSFYNNYGRGFLFTKDGEEVLAVRSEHFGRYVVYEIQNRKDLN